MQKQTKNGAANSRNGKLCLRFHLLHQRPEVSLNVDRQILDIFLKQCLLFPGGKSLVVSPTLWIFAQLLLPILHGTKAIIDTMLPGRQQNHGT